MELAKGSSTSVLVLAGQSLHLSGAGSVVRSDRDDVGITFSEWPVVVGPLTINSTLRIIASDDAPVEYSIQTDEYVNGRVVMVAFDDLPAFGETGVLYQTEAGLRVWDEWAGIYQEMDGETPVPILVDDEGTDPVIAGDPEIGATLSVVSNGVWLYRPTSFAYQWAYDDNGEEEIEGATASTYVVAAELEGESIYCKVTASNIAGDSVSAEDSNTIGPIIDPT